MPGPGVGRSPIVIKPVQLYFALRLTNLAEQIIGTPNPKTSMNTQSKSLVETLTNSQIYRDYEQAFSEATGLPIAFRSPESWQLPLHNKRFENPFCAMVAQKSRSCAACLQVQQELSERASEEARTITCGAGLCDVAVPVHLGDRLLGFLQTGQVFRKKPSEAQFEKTSKLLDEWGVEGDPKAIRKAYFDTRVLPPKQLDSVVKLLTIFAQHLSIVSNQLVVQTENAEPQAITKAKRFIQDHHADPLSLGMVAKAVNTSSFYFCKLFKKSTGINFTDFVSRVRIEKGKNLLLNPNLRISEIAFAIGFQSLTHFNRVFKTITGQSPTAYRSQLMRGKW